jgi:NDP-sugar pyrophosphorylase family protein
MQPTLVILAAGMASRYGSMKQTQGFGPSGETIMEYSIYDAIRAGFGKVVFIIRRDFAEPFKAALEPKLSGKIETAYVFQEKESFLPPGLSIPAERTKPWGTAHALLCAQEAVKEPFAVINADDFYGRDGFDKAVAFLRGGCQPDTYCIIGYELAKTLSEHGTVSRGVCEVDSAGNLISIKERTNIYRKGDAIVFDEAGQQHEVPFHSSVSMNFWCFHPSAFSLSERLFHAFVRENADKPKAEFFIPLLGDEFVKAGGKIQVIPTSAQWFGVTYQEDAPGVKASIDALVSAGAYPVNLWS